MGKDIKERTIYRNPNLIITTIDDSFVAVLNPFVNDGLKVININQYAVLNSIPLSGEAASSISQRSNHTEEEIIQLFKILEEKGFVSDNNIFPKPTFLKKTHTLNLWVQTTNECNLRCSYCYIHTLGKRDFITADVFDAFVKKLVETVSIHNLKFVNLRLAGGEPLLKFTVWKKFILRLRFALSEFGCTLKIAFLSNLVALNDDILGFMKENHIGIGVSLDGINEYHNATRHFKNGKGSFEIVKPNLLRLQECGFRPSLMTVISNSNLDGLEEFTKFVIGTNLHTRYSFVSGEDIDISKLISTLKRCYQLFENAINDGYEFSRLHQLCDLKFDKLFFQTCSDGFNGGALYTNGDIYFCQRHFGADKPLGSIYEDRDILTIIRSKSLYDEVSDECESCIYRYICTSGCPIERKFGKDPHCYVYKEIIPTILRLRGLEHLHRYKVNKNPV